MFKSIQIKIILILIIISLLMIVVMGLLYISSLEKTKENVQEQEVIESNIDNTKTVLIIEANAPTPILNPKPRSVRVNISLPIQSVPKICSKDGG